jgi:hypothetical protein
MLEIWIYLVVLPFSICVLIFVCLSVLLFATAFLEKRHIHLLAPLPLEEDPRPTCPFDPGPDSYTEKVNELAGQMGFEFQGVFVPRRKGPTRFRATIWRSPKRDILVQIFTVRVGELSSRGSQLVSSASGRYLITTDTFGEVDISGLNEHHVLPNCEFPDLVKHHEEWLAKSNSEPMLFAASDVVEDLDAMRIQHAQRLVDHGYATFLNDEHSTWRYTAKGAVHCYLRSYLFQLFGRMPKHHQYRQKLGWPFS